MVSFREVNAGDAARVLDAFVSDHVEMSRQGDVHDLATACAYVTRMAANPDIRTLVAVDDADQLLAFAAVSVDHVNANGWVFYWAHPDARQRGITSRLVRVLADRELGEGGLHRLELGYRANNPASAAVASAAGFVREGLEREKFLVNGERIDVITAGRLKTDPV
ncbi:MAG TPA: GNAT family protein [Microbacterium sp.]|nr:GNAT family protein [Microbacterium sp.]